MVFVSDRGTAALKYERHMTAEQLETAEFDTLLASQMGGVTESMVHQMSGQIGKGRPHPRTRSPDFLFKTPSKRLQVESVRKFPLTLLNVPDMNTLDVQQAFVDSEDSDLNTKWLVDYALKHQVQLQLLHEKLQNWAVQHNASALQLIPNPDFDIQIKAIAKDKNVYKYVDHNNFVAMLKDLPFWFNQVGFMLGSQLPVQVQMAGVQSNIDNFEEFFNFNVVPDDQVYEYCLKQQPFGHEWLTNPSESAYLDVIKTDPRAIMFIKNPTVNVQLAAIKGDIEAMAGIFNPSPEVQRAYVKMDGFLEMIRNPIPEVQALMQANDT
tara:strand:- start:154 stop:1122 length:969 start_codon:yes stop_codon:yes gene_type:complete